MKTKETIICTPMETVCDLYAEVIWLREEIERLERPTLCVPMDRHASGPKQPCIAGTMKSAIKGG